MHRWNHLGAYGEKQNIALTGMFCSQQMFPSPHGGSESENNTPFLGAALQLSSTNCYSLKPIKV